MKKVYSLILLLFVFSLQIMAQTESFHTQGIPRPEKNISGTPKVKQIQTRTDITFTMNDIVNWTGTGENKAALVIQWNDGKNPDALVWGYKWNGKATGADMLEAIVAADPRLFALLMKGTQFGTTLGGFGYDRNQTNPIILLNGTTEKEVVNGVAETSSYDFDNWKCKDTEDHWAAGWNNAYWSYCIRENEKEAFSYSSFGMTSRELKNGSWDGWWFNADYSMDVTFAPKFSAAPVAAKAADYTKGVFILNEDWFGHSNGTINYLDENSEFVYRVYQKENGSNEQLGITTQYGTIYGDRMYMISKQGSRIVVADARTMKKIAATEHIAADGKSGDGRAFIGIDNEIGYISSSAGIFTYDLKTNTIKSFINGTDGQTGNMLRTSDYVFAVQSKRVLILKNHAVHSTIEGDSYSSLCQSKDGFVWIAAKTKLIKVNPVTLEKTEVVLPAGIVINDSWGAWNAGGFCASSKTNSLYWALGGTFGGGTKVYRFDIDQPSSINNGPIYTLPDKQIFYGAGIRVHPQSDELYIITTQDGWGGNFEHNWVHRVNGITGEQLEMLKLQQYYWFQALPIFPDVAQPVASALQEVNITGVNGTLSVKWEDLISDEDNATASITKTILSNNRPDDLTVTTNKDYLVLTRKSASEGTANIQILFNSNGKQITKNLTVGLNNTVGIENGNEAQKAYRSTTMLYGLETGATVEFYTLSGVLLQRKTANSSSMPIPKGGYVIIRIITAQGVQTLK